MDKIVFVGSPPSVFFDRIIYELQTIKGITFLVCLPHPGFLCYFPYGKTDGRVEFSFGVNKAILEIGKKSVGFIVYNSCTPAGFRFSGLPRVVFVERGLLRFQTSTVSNIGTGSMLSASDEQQWIGDGRELDEYHTCMPRGIDKFRVAQCVIKGILSGHGYRNESQAFGIDHSFRSAFRKYLLLPVLKSIHLFDSSKLKRADVLLVGQVHGDSQLVRSGFENHIDSLIGEALACRSIMPHAVIAFRPHPMDFIWYRYLPMFKEHDIKIVLHDIAFDLVVTVNSTFGLSVIMKNIKVVCLDPGSYLHEFPLCFTSVSEASCHVFCGHDMVRTEQVFKRLISSTQVPGDIFHSDVSAVASCILKKIDLICLDSD